MSEQKTGSSILTKEELDRLIADRRNDPPTPVHHYPKPRWMLDQENPIDNHVRERERRITTLTTRLDTRTRKMEQDWEQSR